MLPLPRLSNLYAFVKHLLKEFTSINFIKQKLKKAAIYLNFYGFEKKMFYCVPMSEKVKIKAGSILISEPFLADPNFSRTVVYIAEHDANGTVGFVVNQPMGLMLKDVIPTEPTEDFLDIPLFTGGPVGNDTLHVIHQLGDHVKGSKFISQHTYWGGDFEQIKFLIGNKNADTRDFKFFVGYSGWGPGQLESEIESNSWIVMKGSSDLVFGETDTKTWEKALEQKGGKFKLYQNSPLRPDWN